MALDQHGAFANWHRKHSLQQQPRSVIPWRSGKSKAIPENMEERGLVVGDRLAPPNKTTAIISAAMNAVAANAAAHPAITPLEFMLGMMADPSVDPALRFKAAQAAAPAGGALAITVSRPDHRALAEALRHRVLEGPGVSDRVTRKAAAERASGGEATRLPMTISSARLANCHRVTSAQVEQFAREVGSEKAAFEVIAAAAMGAGLLRWRSAIKVLDEASDAPAGN